MARTRKRLGTTIVAAAATVALVGLVALPAAGAATTYPAVDQPGVTAKEIKVGGVVTASNDPTGGSLDTAFDGVEGVLRVHQLQGWGVRPQARARLEARRRARQQPLRGPGAAHEGRRLRRPARSRCSCSPAPSCSPKARIPTYGWDINEEWGSENHKPGPANFFTQIGGYHCFTCAAASPQTWLPKKLDRHRIGVLAFNVSQSESCADGPGEQLQEVPDRQDRVPRQEPHVRHARLQRAGRADEGQERRPRHLVPRRERRHHARPRDEEAGPGRGADPAELVQPRADQEERRGPQRELPLHDVRAVRGEAAERRA